MKVSAMLIGLLCVVIVASGQTRVTSNLDSGKFHVVVSAQTQDNTGAIFRWRGNVSMASKGVILRADALEYHSDTGLVEATGNVRVQLAPTYVGPGQHENIEYK